MSEYEVKTEQLREEEFLYGSGGTEPAYAPEGSTEDGHPYTNAPPSDIMMTGTTTEGADQEEDEEEEDDDEEANIVLNSDAVNVPQERSSFRPLFSRPQPNQQRPPGSTPYGFQRPGVPPQMPTQPSIAPQIQSPMVAIPLGQKSAFEIDIDGLDEKPWRKPGADITDYFNYGFNEETWKMYSQKQVTLRLEQSMQGKIKVYQSDQPSTSDLPPELLALTGDSDRGRRKEKPAPRSKDAANKPEAPRGRRQRDQDDSVIQVLASGDDQRSPERRSPRRDDSPRRPASSRERDRGERERPRSPHRRDERPPIPERERPKEDPRDRERRERRERPSTTKREEDERLPKRSRH